MTTPQTIAVLTGDLINSTALGPAGIDRAMKALEKAAKKIQTWGVSPLHFTRHRGDGWQVMLDDPRWALRAAIYFRATLQAIESAAYIGIAEGDVSHTIGENLNFENAEVFALSGRALDNTKFTIYRINYSRDDVFDALMILVNRICDSWTTTQAATVAAAFDSQDIFHDPTATEIAKQLGKSRQAVSKALHSAWFWDLYETLHLVERSYYD